MEIIMNYNESITTNVSEQNKSCIQFESRYMKQFTLKKELTKGLKHRVSYSDKLRSKILNKKQTQKKQQLTRSQIMKLPSGYRRRQALLNYYKNQHSVFFKRSLGSLSKKRIPKSYEKNNFFVEYIAQNYKNKFSDALKDMSTKKQNSITRDK